MDIDEAIERLLETFPAEPTSTDPAAISRHVADLKEWTDSARTALTHMVAWRSQDNRVAEVLSGVNKTLDEAEVPFDVVVNDDGDPGRHEPLGVVGRVRWLVEQRQFAEERLACAMDGTLSTGDGTAQAEIERLRADNADLRGQVEALEVDVTLLEEQVDAIDREEPSDCWAGWDWDDDDAMHAGSR